MQNWQAVQIGRLLKKSNNWVAIESDTIYQEVTVRLSGKGVVPRGYRQGSDIGGERRLQVKAGQFIISRIDARNGASGIIPPELDGAVVTNDFPVFDFDEGLLMPRFLFWLSKTAAFVLACRAASEGTTNRVRLREDLFYGIEIPVPLLAEQHRIASKLDVIAERMHSVSELRQEIYRDGQALLHSVFQRLIQDAPDRPLAEVAPIVRRPVEIDSQGEYPELGVRSFGRGTFHKPTLVGSELNWQKLFRVHAGDVVISNIKAWEGAIAVARQADHGRVGSHRYITCVPKEGIATSDFLCFYLLTRKGIDQVQVASPGSADRNRTLAMSRLERILVPLPPIDVQIQFSKLQEKVYSIQKTHSETQVEIDALLPAVLDKAFKGEL